MHLKSVYITLLTSLFLGLIFLSACKEQTIDPIEDNVSIYSFYGTIQVGNSPNYVRIKNLNEPFLADSNSFDGTVTIENLETGNVSTLRDTVVAFGNNFTYNFIIEDEIELDNTYLLKAERSDGLLSQSIATSPGVTDVTLTHPQELTCNSDINFTFSNVKFPERIDIDISVLYNGQSESGRLSIFLSELKHIEEADEIRIRMSPQNLLVEVFPPILPDNPTFNPYFLFPTVNCNQLDSRDIQISYTHYGPEWHKGRPLRGAIDSESGDVENGLGFFGAYSRNVFTITLEE